MAALSRPRTPAAKAPLAADSGCARNFSESGKIAQSAGKVKRRDISDKLEKRRILEALQAEIARIEGTQSATFVSTAAFRKPVSAKPGSAVAGDARSGGLGDPMARAEVGAEAEAEAEAEVDTRMTGCAGLPQGVGATGGLSFDKFAKAVAGACNAPAWLSGIAAADRQLGPGGLDTGGTHEIKPRPAGPAAGGGTVAAHMALATAFALHLATRRPAGSVAVASSQNLGGRPQAGDAFKAPAREGRHGLAADAPAIVLCATSDMLREIGRPYGPGIEALGIPRHRLLIVEPRKETDVLWALEEGLKSGAVAAAIGCFDGAVALTPARRLALAAQAFGVPCLLVTGGASASAASTSSRWRVAARAGGAHPWDPQAPGAACARVVLEKLRSRVLALPDAISCPGTGCGAQENAGRAGGGGAGAGGWGEWRR